MTEPTAHTGGCHCGKVRYQAVLDPGDVTACNCSICQKRGYVLAFIPAGQFTLLSGEEALADYRFARKHIHHLFCGECGVGSFARGAAPDGTEMVAVNVRCLDGIDVADLTPKRFDGRAL